MATTTRTIGFNGNGQFFVNTRYSDGSVEQSAPFASVAAAAACMFEEAKMEREFAAYEAEAAAAAWERDMGQVRWAEAGGYAAGIARPA